MTYTIHEIFLTQQGERVNPERPRLLACFAGAMLRTGQPGGEPRLQANATLLAIASGRT